MKQTGYSILGKFRQTIPVATPALLIAGLLLFNACSRSRHIKGEGAVISDTRSLSSFNSVESNGSSQVSIVRDSVYRVVVTGYQNLVPIYETRVSGGRLTLEYETRKNVKNDNITVEVHMPVVEDLVLNGSGNINIQTGFEGVFRGRINGSGNLYLKEATFRNASYTINGSGHIEARNALADTAYATISGSGNIYVYAVDYLSAQISGSGDIIFRGKPIVNTQVSGSGKVRSE